ncbi:MAG TPA: hypothetical protein VHA70_13300 [Bauldia sp.]|nr:hypothetical protein [Bauldia sp.]
MRLLLAAVAVVCLSVPANADPATVLPGALAPALGVYVDAILQDRAAALACSKPDSPALDEAAWQRAKASFVATLWANGFAPDFIKGAEARLDAPVTPSKEACADSTTASDLGYVEKSGWPKEIARVFSGLDIAAIASPVSAAQWKAIKDAVAADLPAQKRMLECTAVILPSLMPISVHDWDDMLAKVATKLIAAGLPRDEVTALISGAEANVLWHRAPPEAVPALKASCAKEEAWNRRLYNLEFAALGADIDKLLPPPAEDAN